MVHFLHPSNGQSFHKLDRAKNSNFFTYAVAVAGEWPE
jgi:hypothetical protein